MTRLAPLLAVTVLAACGGDAGPALDEAAAERARQHVIAIYSGACAPDACARHDVQPWMRWQVRDAAVVDGCEPAWPEVDAPGGDCVEVTVGGAGCGPDESSDGRPVEQLALRVVRVWLERDGARWKPVSDAWQNLGGSIGDACG